MRTSQTSSSAWPEGLLLTYYGDDFTGSTDVMEAFTAAGVPTVLFLDVPRLEDLARFGHMRCIGLAGQSRGKSPEWMQRELPAVFERLHDLGAPVCTTRCALPLTHRRTWARSVRRLTWV